MGLIDNKNYDFLWITLKSWRSIFDLASRCKLESKTRDHSIIRSLVERIEIARTSISIVYLVPAGSAVSPQDPIMVTLSRA